MLVPNSVFRRRFVLSRWILGFRAFRNLNKENFARSSACLQTQLSDNKQNFLKCLASKARPFYLKTHKSRNQLLFKIIAEPGFA